MEAFDKTKGSLTRRAFIGASAAAAVLMTSGCAPESAITTTDDTEAKDYRLDGEFDENQPGEWKPVQCWLSCGGKCLLQAYVVDGIVTRIKTDDIYEDDIETFQNRGCVRGRSMRAAQASAERIKYPMKRKNWQPGGGENSTGELRGIDEWERISWDEAYDLIAQEMQRIYDTHGGRSVLHTSFGRTCMRTHLLAPMGGFVPFEFCDSYGSYHMYSGNMGTYFNHGEPGGYGSNDRLDLLNADYIVFQGGNPAWCSGGSPMHHFRRAKEAGAQFVYVGPEYNLTATTLDAKWIPVRPGTDTAFLLAVAYEMLRLDEESGDIIDWDFLDRCTVGFDADHMPADATSTENIKAYIQGEYDGIPKSPDWAAEICGASLEDITWFAELMGKNNAVSWLYGYAASRTNGSENLQQIQETVCCMGGHHGKPGHSGAPQYHFFAANDGPDLVVLGDPYPVGKAPELPANPVDDNILHNYLWEAVNTGKYEWFGAVVDYSNGNSAIQQSEERDIDIRMIVNDFGNPLVVRCNTNEGIKAFRKVDFVLDLALAFNPTAQYSDIVLPIATNWEDENGDDYHLGQQNRETLIWQQFGVKSPYFESKSDREIVYEIGKRLNLDVDTYFPYTGAEQHLYRLINATVVKPDAATDSSAEAASMTPGTGATTAVSSTMMPLVTITDDDIKKHNIRDIDPQEGLVTLDEMIKNGIYHVARTVGDSRGYIAYESFVNDPENNPRPSKSGKIELYCQTKADIFPKLGWQTEDARIQPYANYVKPKHGYEESFSNWETKEKGQYPIQVFNGHYLRRSHSSFDSTSYLREAFVSPVFMSAIDAQERGITNGDWIRLYNDSGAIVRQASVVETMMPGVCNSMHGSWFELDDDGNSINGGTNILTDSSTSAGAQQGFNTVLCEIEKYANQDIEPDITRPVIVPAGIEA